MNLSTGSTSSGRGGTIIVGSGFGHPPARRPNLPTVPYAHTLCNTLSEFPGFSSASLYLSLFMSPALCLSPPATHHFTTAYERQHNKLTDPQQLRWRRGARSLHKFLRTFGPGSVDPDVAAIKHRGRTGRAHSVCAPERVYAATVRGLRPMLDRSHRKHLMCAREWLCVLVGVCLGGCSWKFWRVKNGAVRWNAAEWRHK